MSTTQEAGPGASRIAKPAWHIAPADWPDLAAPVLILVAPFLAFAAFHNYDHFTAEILAGAGALVAIGLIAGLAIATGGPWRKALLMAALLTLYVDFQFGQFFIFAKSYWSYLILIGAFAVFFGLSLLLRQHLSVIVAAILGTIVAATVLFPPSGAPPQFTAQAPPATNAELRPVIHLVLDEHIGIEGIPTDVEGGAALKQDLKAFFAERGFRVFGKAYSRFYYSFRSISHILNPDRSFDQTLFENRQPPFTWRLKTSSYFDRLVDAGYSFNIYQFLYLDYCAAAQRRLARCHSYNVTGLDNLQGAPLSWPDKLRVIAGFYLFYPSSYGLIRDTYRRLAVWLNQAGVAAPTWQWERTDIGGIPSLVTLDRLIDDLRGAGPGEYYFAHIDLPHYPYIYDRDCRLLPPGQWASRALPKALWPITDVTEFRKRHYRRYFEQTRCIYARLGALLDVVAETEGLADAVVILHGDHGSRMALDRPSRDRRAQISKTEFVDDFSTLFAVRAPDIRPGYDRRMVPVQRLLSPLGAPPADAVPPGSAGVMLLGKDGWAEVPMPDFGDAGTPID